MVNNLAALFTGGNMMFLLRGLGMTLLLTICGCGIGLVGGFLASVLFNVNPVDGAFDISSIVTATIGAVVVVLVVGAVNGSRSGRGVV